MRKGLVLVTQVRIGKSVALSGGAHLRAKDWGAGELRSAPVTRRAGHVLPKNPAHSGTANQQVPRSEGCHRRFTRPSPDRISRLRLSPASDDNFHI